MNGSTMLGRSPLRQVGGCPVASQPRTVLRARPVSRDGAQALTCGGQARDLGETRVAVGLPRPPVPLQPGWRSGRRRRHLRRRVPGDRLGRVAETTAVAVDDELQRIGEVPEQMPAVRDLHGIRCATTSALGVGPGAITGDHLDAGVVPQPCRERRRLAVRQEVDHAPLLEVDQHRAVALASSPRPVVDAEDAGDLAGPWWAARN